MPNVDVTREYKRDQTLDDKVKVSCWSCDNDTWHDVIASVDESGSYTAVGIEYERAHQIVQCRGCDSISFRRTYRDDTLEFDEKGDYDADATVNKAATAMVFPPRLAGRKELADVWSLPENIRVIYQETYQALVSEMPILASVGIRALVEGVCKEEKAEGLNLEKKIDDLVAKQVLTPVEARVLHQTRFMGNRAAHDLKPPTATLLGSAMRIAEHLLQSVYILPNLEELHRSKRNAE